VSDVDAIRWIDLTDAELAKLRSAVADAAAKTPEVIAAYHFGSSARRRPARDLDIGLFVDRPARASIDVEAIVTRLANLTGRGPDDFDVRVVNDADPVFLGNLMRDGKLCFERDREARIAFEVMAMNSWLDFQPAWDRLRRGTLEVWSRG
jgi:predicted nucleotidyltransferase